MSSNLLSAMEVGDAHNSDASSSSEQKSTSF